MAKLVTDERRAQQYGANRCRTVKRRSRAINDCVTILSHAQAHFRAALAVRYGRAALVEFRVRVKKRAREGTFV